MQRIGLQLADRARLEIRDFRREWRRGGEIDEVVNGSLRGVIMG